MFKKLLKKQRKDEAKPSKPLPPALSSSILASLGSKGIPPMPGAAQKAFSLATDPNAEARDFIEVIESDEALSARVIKIANSVYFERGKQSKTIEESVLVIGIGELRCLLNATTLSELFPSRHAARTQLWANDIATAITARLLAQRVLPSKSEAAFLAGLMHDIGKLLLLQRLNEEYLKVLKRVDSEGLSFSQAEQDQFVFDHTEVGQLIAERWNFSAELTDAIRLHHEPRSSLEPASLPLIIKTADCIAHSLGLGHQNGFRRLKESAKEELADLWASLPLPQSDQKGFLLECERSYHSEYDLYAGKGI